MSMAGTQSHSILKIVFQLGIVAITNRRILRRFYF